MTKSAFTLIELLIVIVIVAILAGAMVPMFNTNRVAAQQAKVQAELDAIKTAVMMMHNDCGTGEWPTNAVAPGINTGVGITQATATCTPTPGGNWNGPYLDEWRPAPWGFNYRLIRGLSGANSLSVVSYGALDVVGSTGPVAENDQTLLITTDITR